MFSVVIACCENRNSPTPVREASLCAAMQLKIIWQGCESAVMWCLGLLEHRDSFPPNLLAFLWKELAVSVKPEKISRDLKVF